jgi:hypothetical protein
VIAAGTIYNYSFPGLAWLLGASLIWMFLVAWRERDPAADRGFLERLRFPERLRGAGPAAGRDRHPGRPRDSEIFRLASFGS